jgi:hypothetical protein
MIRLVPNHAFRIIRAQVVQFTFDGEPVEGRLGESLVAALMRAGHMRLRDAPQDGTPRGAFCCMGLCQECAVKIADRTVEACRYDVTEGLIVERVG